MHPSCDVACAITFTSLLYRKMTCVNLTLKYCKLSITLTNERNLAIADDGRLISQRCREGARIMQMHHRVRFVTVQIEIESSVRPAVSDIRRDTAFRNPFSLEFRSTILPLPLDN